ncbi:MAG: leucine-rich repeat domain-containing protein [Anaerolineae bacterium]|nr:leucine-rich repeat domain-containing protein [Anaerolineae bacterium]
MTRTPETTFFPQKLEEALLQNNQLTQIPDDINLLTHLRELYLGDNRLKKLPEMSKLKKLEILILRGNPLPKSEIERVKRMLPNTIVSV